MPHQEGNIMTFDAGSGLFDLSGKTAIVTGSNGGIGLGIASALARAGAQVMIVARNAEKNAAAVKVLTEIGGVAAAVVANIADDDSCRAAIATTEERFGAVDILVNNAGIAIRKKPETYSLAEWHEVIDTNLTSAFLCSQLVHPLMAQAGSGKIINIGSMMSIFGAPLSVPYAASKGGIVQLTRSLAAAWAADGIQVNAILPGFIDTELTEVARQQIPGLNDRVMSRTPAGRWGLPRDFAGISVFLASAASDFVTGVAVPVDGGYSISA
jgi:2-dehydro-3-deoxy-D-gluconate 5-dehydrogenase